METVDLIMIAADEIEAASTALPIHFIPVRDRPVLLRAFDAFASLPNIGVKMLVCDNAHRDLCAEMLEVAGVSDIVVVGSGRSRHESIYRALQLVESSRVLIQNVNMPFVTPDLVTRLLSVDGACVAPVRPLRYPVFQASGHNAVEIPRGQLHLVSSPQLLCTAIALACYRRAQEDGFVSGTDFGVMQRYGHQVTFVPDIEENIGLASEMDFVVAEALLERQEGPLAAMHGGTGLDGVSHMFRGTSYR